MKGRLTGFQKLWIDVHPRVGDGSGYFSICLAFRKEVLIGEGITLVSDHSTLNDGILRKRPRKSSEVIVVGDYSGWRLNWNAWLAMC